MHICFSESLWDISNVSETTRFSNLCKDDRLYGNVRIAIYYPTNYEPFYDVMWRVTQQWSAVHWCDATHDCTNKLIKHDVLRVWWLVVGSVVNNSFTIIFVKWCLKIESFCEFNNSKFQHNWKLLSSESIIKDIFMILHSSNENKISRMSSRSLGKVCEKMLTLLIILWIFTFKVVNR